MKLKRSNEILLVSLIILGLLVFGAVFLTPSFINSLKNDEESWLSKAPKKAGNMVTTDRKNMFALEIPSDWKILEQSDPVGYVTTFSAHSPDYKMRENTTGEASLVLPSELVSGMSFGVAVLESSDSENTNPVGNIISEEDYSFNDINAKYYVFQDQGLNRGVFHEVRFDYAGLKYLVKILFDPESNPGGEEFFKFVLSSLSFNKVL